MKKIDNYLKKHDKVVTLIFYLEITILTLIYINLK